MRVLVCGGRTYKDRSALFRVLDGLVVFRGPIDTIIHGCAPGADALAGEWAVERNVEILRFPADWDRHGRSAGPIRNRQMLLEGHPGLVVAFPGGHGTANMIRQATARGVEVMDAFRPPTPPLKT